MINDNIPPYQFTQETNHVHKVNAILYYKLMTYV